MEKYIKEISVSVVLATYNGEKFLKNQLLSISDQSTLPDEIVIIDDKSSDKTVDIIEEYINYSSNLIEVKLFKNTSNQGVVKSFKFGLLKATKDVIFLCDQDDLWDKRKIEKIKHLFLNSPSTKIITHGYHIIDEKERIINRCSSTKNKKLELKDCVKRNNYPGCTYAFNRTYFERYMHKIDNSIYIHDWFFLLIGSAYETCYFFNEPLIKYRIHANNTIGLKRGVGFNNKSLKRTNVFINRAILLNSICKILSDENKVNPVILSTIVTQALFYQKRVDELKNRSIRSFLIFLLRWFKYYDSFFSIIADLIIILNIKKLKHE